ncbi:rRNA maturation RNase YbeY [Candidatus Parcubacteria bacterium]|nr:MAG: rRNA maturation RNase YbeY [Candidatus Parcubacteria bacterium]
MTVASGRTARERAMRTLNRFAGKTLRMLGKTGAGVEISLISEADMREIERRTLGREKKVLNVLAFPEPTGFPHPETKKEFLGEIYVNWERYGSRPSELAYLMVHGLLHLLGYRHGRKNDMMAMYRLERRVLERLGVRQRLSHDVALDYWS